MFKCFYFQFTSQLNTWPFFSSVNSFMLISTLGSLLIIIASITAAFNKKRLLAVFICDILLTTILITDTNFCRYYYSPMNIPVLIHADLGTLNSIDQSVLSLFKIKDIIYLLDLPFMLIGLFLAKRNKLVDNFVFKKRIIAASIILLAGLSLITSAYYKANMGLTAYNTNYITYGCFLLSC